MSGQHCTYCLAPFEGDSKAGQPVPLCLTLQKLDAQRTKTCLYIERLRRLAEDLDTAAMGLASGHTLGGTHLQAAMRFASQAQSKYTELGEFLLPEMEPA